MTRDRPGGSVGPSLVLLGYPYTPDPDTGRGIDQYLSVLARGFRKQNVPFEMLENGRFPDHLQQLLVGEPKILSQIARHRGGVWHAVSPVGGRMAVFLGRHPLVTTVHDVMPFYVLSRHPARYRFLQYCVRMACRASDRIIVPFPSVQRFLVDQLHVPDDRVSLVPYGIDPVVAGVADGGAAPDPGTARADTVLFFGSWNPIDRGGDLVVRAMVRVLKERPRAHLLLSCKGPQTEALRRLAQKLGVERAIGFIGFVPREQLAGTFRSAAAAVFPSRLSFGLLEMQSMYAGVPLVVTDVRDQSYFVGHDGLVCPPDDPDALGTKLAGLLGDERLQAELARRGRLRVREFSTERMVKETLRAYSTVGWSPIEG